jgi:hypothetical protein
MEQNAATSSRAPAISLSSAPANRPWRSLTSIPRACRPTSPIISGATAASGRRLAPCCLLWQESPESCAVLRMPASIALTPERRWRARTGLISSYIQDGSDCERFLKTLHARCWLAGLGWLTVGAGGQLLERSIVDRIVGSPERLVFEGPPVLDSPLAQDKASRRPTAIEGNAFDSITACPKLSLLEQAQFRELRAKEAARLKPEAERSRKAFIAEPSSSRRVPAWRYASPPV